MKISTITLLLFFSPLANANVTLHLGENIVALAAKDAKVSMFSRSITLPAGEQRLIIKFESSVNPESVNQGKGRITSAPYIFTFNSDDRDEITLTIPVVTDEKDAKKQAENPQFRLLEKSNAIPFTLTKIDPDSINIFTDYKSLLNKNNKTLQESQPESGDALDRVRSSYTALSDKQKLSFMKWLLKD